MSSDSIVSKFRHDVANHLYAKTLFPTGIVMKSSQQGQIIVKLEHRLWFTL
jgi:hypothetical protein